MLTRDEIIKEFTDNLEAFTQLAYNIAGENDAPDLMQSCTLMLLEMKEDKLQAAYNPAQGLKPYFIRMLCLQYKSKTSYFHRDYRKQEIQLRNKKEDIILNEPQSEGEYKPDYFKQINLACQSVYNNTENKIVAELGKAVWNLYVERGSLRKVLAALPKNYRDIVDLKTVHNIVLYYQESIKNYIVHIPEQSEPLFR